MISRRRFLAGAMVALASACAVSPQAPPPRTFADTGIVMPETFDAWTRGHYPERVLVFDRYQPMNGGVAFVGDSITEGGDWERAFPGLVVRNYGIGGDTTEGLERRLSQIAAARPAKIFLLIGTNDLGNYDAAPATIVANYARLLDRLAADLPETEVVMQTVLPREPENAEAIRQINAGLAALAAARTVHLVDIYTPFAVEGGRLDPAVTEDDLHLTPAGYARWYSLIGPLVRAP
jgi:lysophospholipase L1-like esterase